MTRRRVSAIIITFNEAHNLADCLRSLTWCEEIIVVDSYSTDNTIEIAKQFTDKVYLRKWEGFAPQRHYALSLANEEWVISLDADERLSPRLSTLIQEKLSEEFIEEDGFSLRCLPFFKSYPIKHCGWYPIYHLRLFRRESAFVNFQLIHEGFGVKGKVSDIHADFLHYTARSFKQYMNKQIGYAKLDAQKLIADKKYRRHISIFDIALHALGGFLKGFISQKGFLDGLGGLCVSFLHGNYKYLLYKELRKLNAP